MDRIILETFYPVILKKGQNTYSGKNTFDAWSKISNKQEITNGTDLLTSPLWYNREMSYKRCTYQHGTKKE